MRRRRLLLAPLLPAVVAGAAAVALWAYDRTQSDRIASGVTIAGVDVGSLTSGQAAALLRERLLPRLREPVVVVAAARRVALVPAQAGLSVDVAGMVREAVVRSRRGGLVTRLERELGGGRVHAAIPLRAGWSSRAVAAFVARVARSVYRPPRAGRLALRGRMLRVVPRRDGVALREQTLARLLGRALTDPTGQRALRAPLRVLVAPLPRAAVTTTLGALARRLARPPRNARVDPSPDSLAVVPSHPGVTLRREALKKELDAALATPGPARLLPAATRAVPPRLPTAALARRYPSYITIDRGRFTLRVYQHLRLVRSYPIAVGMQGLATPAGLYHIQNKVIDPSWAVPDSPWAGALAGRVIPPGPQDPLKARWLGLWNGAGIHGTDETASIGHAFSHGCVRMLIPDVIDLYNRVQVGTPVYIGD